MNASLSILAKRLAPALALGMLALAGAEARATACSDTFNSLSTVRANGFTYNKANTRNNASSINSANVGTLGLALSHVASGQVERRGAPVVTDQAIVFAAGRDVIAMNRKTGCTYWTYSVDDKSTPLVGGNVVRGSSIYYLNEFLKTPLIVVGDFYAKVYAINAKTGKLVWSKFMGTDASHHMVTGGFQYASGTMLVPIATKEVITTAIEILATCCSSHGLLQAIDPYTGNIKWTYDTAPAAAFNSATGSNGPSGMSIWGTPAIDTTRGQVYVGTGQNLSEPATTNSDAILALDFKTGKVKWVFQGTQGDAWNAGCEAPAGLDSHCPANPGKDYDFGAPPILTKNKSGADVIIAGEKSGVVYSLNPASGALNWQRRVGAGANLGGVHWGMAVDAAKVYVGVSDIIVNKFQRLAIADLLNVTAAAGANTELTPGGTPGVYALDLNTGAVVWERHLTHTYEGASYPSIFSAAVSVTNDLLFAASLDGVVHAFRTSDGAEVWNFNTAVSITDSFGVAGNGGTTDSVGPIVGGVDLLINSGYSTFGSTNKFQAGNGNALFMLRLAGK